MTTIAGASQYVTAFKLGIKQATPTLLGGGGGNVLGSVSILDVGRSVYGGNGIGLSPSARAINNSFLGNTAEVNKLLSLTVGTDTSVEGSTIAIKALRAGLPDSALAPSLRGDAVDTEA